MTTKCTGLMGRIFGHKFVPVITKSAVRGSPRIEAGASALVKLMEAHREQHFHGCICQRCGAVTGEKK